ncbi:glycosyltransferase family 87 protein [Bradyrhizobium sp. WD16]|uniref:glycosyltransferase family 87 protein n=1 Tax=Bradyrhizobium sp. WD16 TaxID=1521768 RepID=UPI0020A460F2|nr:glycosyltransferase family 87 protein [Bradyrhizobium sp. WD16]UTD27285.1 hypothetical protein DB459_10455 [Bradyrhizobium sp. WD16]
MSVSEPLPPLSPVDPLPPWPVKMCVVLCIAHALFFPLAYGHLWIIDGKGLGIPADFVHVWASGRLALEGHPSWAYDWDFNKALQVATLGQGYDGHFAWQYPPTYLFVAAALASLPYVAAFILWPLVSFVPFGLTMRLLVGRPFGWLLAGAFPAFLVNVTIGQNGFLTAALIGATLYLLPSRKVAAGICLGLLSYKPQYGLLFPLLLMVAGEWRAFFAAVAVTLTLAAAAWLVFGTESWVAFFHALPKFSQAFLSDGKAYWGKMQSLYTTVRLFQGSEAMAWVAQLGLDALVVVALVTLWRGCAAYWLKAAALATGTLLVTPYIFIYDLMALAIPVALLVRTGLAEGFLGHELPALGGVFLLLAIYIVTGVPTGFAATVLVAVLLGLRYAAATVAEPRRQAAEIGA